MNPFGGGQLSRDAIITFGRQFFAGLCQMGSILLISRLLGPEGTGIYTVALFLPTLLSLLMSFGIGPANVYFVASGQFTLAHAWQASRALAVVMAATGLLVGSTVVVSAGETLFPGVGSEILLLALLIYPPSLLTSIIISLAQAKQNFRAYNLLVIVQPLVALSLLFLLWAIGRFTLPFVLATTAMSHLVALAAGLIRLTSLLAPAESGNSSLHYLRLALPYGLKTQMGNIVGFLNYRLDIYCVNFFLGPAATGLYAVAVRLVEQLWMISVAVSTVLLPRLASMGGDEVERGVLTSLVSRMTMWVTLMASGVLAAIADPLIGMLFGDEFRGAAIALIVLLPGVVFVSSGRVIANDLAARGLVTTNLYLAILTLVVNVTGNLLLIPPYGIIGAAVATSFAYVSDFLVRLTIMHRVSRVRWLQFVLLRREDALRFISILRGRRSEGGKGRL